MSFFDIILIGISLAMDAVCVSVSNGISMKGNKIKLATITSITFGIFQGIMPLIGFFAGSLFIDAFSKYSVYIVAIIFLILGVKMIYDGFNEKDEDETITKISFGILMIQGIATSIDALAVGVGFCAIKVNIVTCSLIICFTTIVMTFIAFLLGKKIRKVLNNNAEIFAGILLLLIALKTLIFNFI